MKKIYILILLLSIFLISRQLSAQELLPYIYLDERMTNEKVNKIADTIKYIETKKDTKCTRRGRDGEYGCFQILPSTWNGLSKKHLGQVKGFSLELERPVVEMEIKDMLTLQKLEPKQIFKKWNSGNLKPCKKGVNKKGTPYDSCKYVEDAMAFYNKIK